MRCTFYSWGSSSGIGVLLYQGFRAVGYICGWTYLSYKLVFESEIPVHLTLYQSGVKEEGCQYANRT